MDLLGIQDLAELNVSGVAAASANFKTTNQ